MFEATLEAQTLDAGENRFRSLSTAVLAHAGVIGAILAVTAMIIPTPLVPEPPGLVVVLPRFEDFEKAMGPHDPPPPIKKSGPATAAHLQPPVVPKPIEQPTETPTTVPTPPPTDDPGNDLPGEGVPNGDPNGDPRGVPFGTGKPDGDGGGEGPFDGGPVIVTGDMVRPVLVSKIEPVYPNAARKARLPGRVVLEAVIGLDGSVESVSVISSSSSLFDEAAMAAVRRWKYTPARMNGGPVRVYYTVQVSFVLR
jgi:protein TonB